MTTLLALVGVSIVFWSIRNSFTRANKLDLPRADEQITLYPARWPYFVCMAGLVVGIGLPTVILVALKDRGFFGWMAMISMGLITVGPSIYGLCTMPRSKIVVTERRIEYHHWNKCDIIAFDQVFFVRMVGLDIVIDLVDSGAAKTLRVPLVFRKSRELVVLLLSMAKGKELTSRTI